MRSACHRTCGTARVRRYDQWRRTGEDSLIDLYLQAALNEPWLIGLDCFAGVVSYLGASTFNDSVVSVAPVFWVMLGAGMSALRRSVSSDHG